jgi:hypothetical protein
LNIHVAYFTGNVLTSMDCIRDMSKIFHLEVGSNNLGKIEIEDTRNWKTLR